jgi:cytochrome c556
MRLCYSLPAWFVFAVYALALFAETPGDWSPERIENAALPNAYRLTDNLLSGGQPQGEAGFKALKELGIRTVVSVDGAKPDLASAKKFGLRYVHLPHGYDGIPNGRLVELTKAVRDLPGPVYIHCHHGKHRSPAAAAAACVSAGLLTNDKALAVLAAAGTSPEYRGLYRTVKEAKPWDQETMDSAKVTFHETVLVPPLAEAMAAIENTHDNLKVISAAGWMPTAEHADIDPPHEALLLREHFTELLRTDEVNGKAAEFRKLLMQSESDARRLEDRLRSDKLDIHELNAIFQRITANCVSCHQKFRDIPLSEKSENVP